jgi:Spy/CpxP family protein refolding chaperone
MNRRIAVLAVATCALSLSLPLLAQQTPPTTTPRTPPVDQVKTYLSLTDQQVQQLQQLITSERQANQTRQQEIQTKQTQLQQLLTANSNDAAALGRLLIDIQALRRQVETTHTNFQTQAVALLNDAQKTKLKALDDASKLAPTIGQAVSLNLLTPARPPNAGAPGIGGPGPGPGGPGGGMGPMGPRFRQRPAPPVE